MADGFIQLPEDSTGKKIDTSDLVVGASTSVHRERYVAADPTSATGLATVTSSGGLFVQVTNPFLSTTVTVSNPSTSVNVANTPTILTASSGYLVRSLSSGTVTLSSNPTVVLSSPTSLSSGLVSLTSGTVTLSSNPTVVSASSGLVQISGTPTVTATAATNPWSSAPSFNIPLVSASSGFIQISGGTFLSSGLITLTSDGITQAIVTGSSGVGAIVTSSGALLVSGTPGSVSTAVNLLSSGGVFYPVSSSYGLTVQPFSAASTFRLVVATTISKISSAPGVLWGLVALTTAVAAAGGYLRLYDLTTGNATSSGSMGLAGACANLRVNSSVTGMPYEESYYWPQGVKFNTACCFDMVLNATSTAGATLAGWVTAQYTS